VHVIVQLQKHGSDAERTAGAQKRVDVIISHAALEDNSTNNGSDGNSKYSTCSLLLQIGNILGVCPPYAPLPSFIIFNKILENWRMRRDGENNDGSRTIHQLSEIIDGDEIVLCCGDYVKDSTASLSNEEVDLLALLPSKHNTVSVSLAAVALAKERATTENGKGGSAGKHCSVDINDDSDDDSDIEDVTDVYVSKNPRASPEVIDLEDVSSDDDNSKCDDDASRDDDERSDMVRNQDIESTISDSDSSSCVEDVTEIMSAKRNEQVQKMMDDAEEICDSDSDQDCPEDQGVVEKKRKRTGRSQSTVQKGGVCVQHGASLKRCGHKGCTNYARKGGVCIRHGAAKVTRKTCSHKGCTNQVQRGGVCTRHGAYSKTCSHEGCTNLVQKGIVCIRHGGTLKTCSHEGCLTPSHKGGVCWKHGATVKKCSHEGCTIHVVQGGVRISHGATLKNCSHEGCVNNAVKDGVCWINGAKELTTVKKCSRERCTNQVQTG